MNKKIIVISVLIAILFAGAFAGIIFYYNNEITKLTSAHIVKALGVSEVPYNAPNNAGDVPYSRLYISGTVTNTGRGAAFNAGLHVVAYTANGTLEINMTVPLVNDATFGTDNATDAWVSSWVSAWGGSVGSSQLGNLSSGQIATIDLNIYHEGTVTNWTVTPVWTNSP